MSKKHQTAVSRVVGRLTGAAAAALVIVALGPVGPAAGQEAPDNESCLTCHDGSGMTATLQSGETLDVTVDRSAYEGSVHGDLSCTVCHQDVDAYPHRELSATNLREYTIDHYEVCSTCHEVEFSETLDAVHSQALQGGNVDAAVCTDCHGAHYITDGGMPSVEIPHACRDCHSEVYDRYEASVHGAGLLAGNPDVPSCTDCHGVHRTESVSDSPFHLFSPQICAECHDDDELMTRYGISTEVFETYVADFHGTTVVLFQKLAPDQETNMPVCIDCHGVHDIARADDPESAVFRENLLPTCQRCHPDATSNFPAAWMSHYQPSLRHSVAVFLVNLFYRIFIPTVVGTMLVFVILDMTKRFRVRRQRRAT